MQVLRCSGADGVMQVPRCANFRDGNTALSGKVGAESAECVVNNLACQRFSFLSEPSLAESVIVFKKK